MKPGVVSNTFRHLLPEQIIQLAKDEKFSGIEWGGDVHVPHGNLNAAYTIGLSTRKAGLETAAYGSYYIIGKSEEQGLHFDKILATAQALDTKIIRVWAGERNSEDADRIYWEKIIGESKFLAEAAAKKGITLVLEFHENTLINNYHSCKKLLEEINCPNMRTYWQPMNGAGVEKNCSGLKIILPYIAGIHVFHWWPDSTTRHLLSIGNDDWLNYLGILKSIDKSVYALLEFVKDDSVENFRKDAITFHKMLNYFS